MRLRNWLRHHRLGMAGWAAVAVFAVLAGRFWHPYYGFTRFLQLDEVDARVAVRGLREHPAFVYPGENGYDGAAYVQIAFHPLLNSDELRAGVGNVAYRGRRILASAAAWLLAGGQPAYIANVYAMLNLGVWLALAWLLWRVLPVSDTRSWLAWAGVMFSAGALHSVRLALTDLLAVALVAAGIAFAERQRRGSALGVLASAGLARETALAGVVALWRGPWNSLRAWGANALLCAAVAVPLVLWVAYIRARVGPEDQGFGNLAWPIAGWIEKWLVTFADFVRQPDFRWLNTTTLLALIGLSVQAAYLLGRPRAWRRRLEDPWWRAGMVGVVLMVLLGTPGWEGHPGAATRVLLPMSVAFAVLAVRERASWRWIAAGSLPVFSGVLALWHVPHFDEELASGRAGGRGYLARLEAGWYGPERHNRHVWSWTANEGQIAIATTRASGAPARVALSLRAMAPRVVEVSAGGDVLWRGEVGERLQPVRVAVPAGDDGTVRLTLRSDAPAVREGEYAGARPLGFAVYNLRLE
jgi:hypothetical protein